MVVMNVMVNGVRLRAMTTQCWQRCSNDDDDVEVVVFCCIRDCVNGGIYGLSKE